VSQPNILWICTDQQRYDTLGCYGNEHVSTPAIDELAANGVRFDRCFSQNPVCTPSRASFLTGRYPNTTGARQNGQNIPQSEDLVTTRLADDGYTCGLAGKLHISACNPNKTDGRPMAERRIDDGYSEFHWSHDLAERWPTNEYHHWLRERGLEFDREPVGDSEIVYTSTVAGEHSQAAWCAEKAIDFIEANESFDRPWLFSVNPFDPHRLLDPPEAYLERYLDDLDDVPPPNYEPGELADKPAFQRHDREDPENRSPWNPFEVVDERGHRLARAAYWAMCDLIDDQVARMLAALERTGQRDDTVVIFTSDHGEMLGDHGIYWKGPYFYEPAVRVPLIVSWPERFRTGVESDALVELTDLAPTLADVAGLDRHPGVQGRSLAPLLTGDADADSHRESVYSEYYDSWTSHEEPSVRPFGTMVRTDRYKLVRWHGLDVGELYDLEADPEETDNRWDDPDYRSVRLDVMDRLADRMAETADPLPERLASF